MYSPEQLFVMRMDDLKAILQNPSEPNLFHAAGYLRQLLLTEPLIHQANSKVRHGALHNSTPNTAQTQALHEMSGRMTIADMPFALRLLRSICDVVVTGCEPLYQVLRA
jgi:hypothetical protein